MLKEKLKRKKLELEFKLSIFKVKRTHRKGLRLRFKMLRFCLYHMDKIGIPKDKDYNELLKRLIKTYNNTISELSKETKRFENYIWEEEE